VLFLHLFTFCCYFVATHGTKLIHGAVDCMFVVTIFGFEFVLKEFRHKLSITGCQSGTA
jgi:hypothetical protein